MKQLNIAISCAGSGIGQSVIDSLKLSKLPIKRYALDSNPLAYGIYDCDFYIQTPKVNSEHYITEIIQQCCKHNIELIIPGIDEEVHLFSKHIKDFESNGIEVIVAEAPLLNLCRDKELTTYELQKVSDSFVKSYTKAVFLDLIAQKKVSFPVISKPSSGSASSGVRIIHTAKDIEHINPTDVIQELAIPHKDDSNYSEYIKQINQGINSQLSEISIQLVANKDGKLLGKMATINKLKNGVPVEIIPYDNAELWHTVEQLLPKLKSLGYKGPLNIQGRLTDEGFKFFELNARFTGITGLRAFMGFNEVEACIKSWLNIDKDTILKHNPNLYGTRQFLNKTIHKSKNTFLANAFKAANANAKDKEVILITGATGYIGRNLIDALLTENSKYKIWALVRDKENAKSVLPEAITIFDRNDLDMGALSLGRVDILLHLGFARPHKQHVDIAKSLAFTIALFQYATQVNISRIINVSSQSIYGQHHTPPWSEKTNPAPNSPYSSAKYSSELMLRGLCKNHKHIHFTSLRLASTIGGAKGLVNADLVSKFVKKVKQGEDLKVIGGMQQIERIHIHDTVSALKTLIGSSSKLWKPVYNLGAGRTYTLLELADKTITIGKTYFPESTSKLYLEEKHVDMKFGMDINSFSSDMNWKPKHNLDDIIHSLFQMDY